MEQPLRQTSAALLRRTPELAAYGYVLSRVDATTVGLWVEAIKYSARARHLSARPPILHLQSGRDFGGIDGPTISHGAVRRS